MTSICILKDYYYTFGKIISFNLQIYNFRRRKYILIKYDQQLFNITAFGFIKTYSIVQHILTFVIFFTEIFNLNSSDSRKVLFLID